MGKDTRGRLKGSKSQRVRRGALDHSPYATATLKASGGRRMEEEAILLSYSWGRRGEYGG